MICGLYQFSTIGTTQHLKATPFYYLAVLWVKSLDWFKWILCLRTHKVEEAKMPTPWALIWRLWEESPSKLIQLLVIQVVGRIQCLGAVDLRSLFLIGCRQGWPSAPRARPGSFSCEPLCLQSSNCIESFSCLKCLQPPLLPKAREKFLLVKELVYYMIIISRPS